MKDTWKRWCWDNSVKFIDKDRPKKRTKKVIGELYAVCEPVDDEEFSVLTEVERLIRQGVEVFTEIPYKSSVIEFYYFPQEDCDERFDTPLQGSGVFISSEADLADCHITPQSEAGERILERGREVIAKWKDGGGRVCGGGRG